ncbi:hypothetical protein ALO74_200024 [Pseudomonas syringae pv. cunninghamiae]|nr:hypothetical protein ALO74_200024 [Pseudomonas syringae pv. cunninghamiae]
MQFSTIAVARSQHQALVCNLMAIDLIWRRCKIHLVLIQALSFVVVISLVLHRTTAFLFTMISKSHPVYQLVR